MNKIKKIIWFATRPKYFFILLEILKNKLSPSYNNSSLKTCRIKQISLKSFSRKVFKKNNKNHNLNKHIDFKNIVKKINNNKTMLKQGQNNRKYKIILNNQNIMKMSGASSISLIYKIIREKKPKNILETGVAYGWSSYSILLAILHNKLGKLISIDLPYPLMNEKRNIGMVVPKKLTRKWKLIFGRDTDGIKIALKKFDYKIDFFHYDSDKNYRSKLKNLLLVWKHMRNNGIIICDDINDNYAFFDFAKKIKKNYHVLKYDAKYLGILFND